MNKLRILPLAFICTLVSAPTLADDLITVGGPDSQGLAHAFDLTLRPTSMPNVFLVTPVPGSADGYFDDFQNPVGVCGHHLCPFISLNSSPIPIDPQQWGTLEVKFTHATDFVSAEVSLDPFDHEVRLIALNKFGTEIGSCSGVSVGGLGPPEVYGNCGFQTSYNPSSEFGTFQLSEPGISEVLIAGAASCAECGLGGGTDVAEVQFRGVPEPATVGLLGLGLAGLGFARRKRKS